MTLLGGKLMEHVENGVNVLNNTNIDLLNSLQNRNQELYSSFLKLKRQVESILNNRISQVFPSYTLHDVNHSLRIMEYMDKIIGDIGKLTDLEIMILVSSALLHDIGMAPTEEEVSLIKEGKLEYNGFKYQAFLKKFNFNHIEAIQDYIRLVHAKRSSEYIKNNLKEIFTIPSMPAVTYEDVVAKVCASHTENHDWLEANLETNKEKGPYEYNEKYCAIVLRLADILDFDSQRTPSKLFDTLTLNRISKDEWKQHFIVENKEKIKEDTNGIKYVSLFGKCGNSFIHRKILKYIDWINIELYNSIQITSKMNEKYQLHFGDHVINRIESKGYTIADLKLTIDYQQITSLLMGEQIYGNKKMGLRELVQNSIDACRVRKEIEDENIEFGEEQYEPIVKIFLDKCRNEVIISDNGIGMNLSILKNYFLNVGASFYQSDEFLLKDYQYKPIGNYGIGFLACFMLSDTVQVQTKNFQDSYRYDVELSKGDEYVCVNHETDYNLIGTRVILEYDKFMAVWDNDYTQLKSFVDKYFLCDDVKIQLINKETQTIHTVNNYLYSEEITNNFIEINASDFLNGIEGTILFKDPTKRIFNNSLDDISFQGDLYLFKDEELLNGSNLEVANILPLSDRNNDLWTIDIPIIEDAAELRNIEHVIEDKNESIDIYIKKYSTNYITIAGAEDIIGTSLKGIVYDGDEIFSGFDYEKLYDFGHQIDADFTRVEKYKYRIVYDEDFTPYLLLISNQNRRPYYDDKKNLLYVRGIFVKGFNIEVDNTIEGLVLEDCNRQPKS